MSAREEVLTRIRSAIGPAADASVVVPRQYRLQTGDGIETFIERLHDYDAQARRGPNFEMEVRTPG